MIIKSIRQIVAGRELPSVPSGVTVREACHVLNRFNVGALVVMRGQALAAVLSERDVIRKCIGQNRLTSETLVDDVMTPAPRTIDIDSALADALAIMSEGHFRHLPVIENGRVTAMLSIRDIPTDYRLMFERFSEYRGSVAYR